jgi:signal transduction histidine kinase
MKYKFKDTILVLFFLNIVQFDPLIAQNKYPSVGAFYTKYQLDSMLKKFQSSHDTLGLGFTYWAYSKNEEKTGSINNSPIINLRKSMECFQAANDLQSYYNVRGSIGSFLMNHVFMKQFAKEYIQDAVKYFRKNNKASMELDHLVNFANIYLHENNFKEALPILERAEFLNKTVNNESYAGRLHSAYSDYYSRQGRYNEALIHIDKSYDIAKQLKIEWLEALSLYFKSKCYMNLGNQDARLEALMASLNVVENNINQNQLKMEIYDNIQDYYFKKKNYIKSNEYAIKAKLTLEKNYYSKIESDLRSFSEYNLMEKQRLIVSRIELQKKLTDIELEKVRFRQYMFLGLLILTLISLALLFIAFLNRKRIGKLKAVELEKNMQIGTLNALINGQELERQRISQELHDGIGTMLSRIKVLMGKGTPIQNLTQMIDDTCSEVRSISGNLQPHTLANFGLIGALEDFASKHSISTPAIIFQHFGEPTDLGINKNLMIYRIIQELVTNSLKHANAKEILMEIIFTKENMTLTVEDDGIGFDEKTLKTDSNGWNNIRSRVNFLQGQLNLNADVNTGTSVTIDLPIS